MASSSACADQVSEAGSSQCGAMGGSGLAEVLPVPARLSEQASSSSPGVLSGAEKYHPGSVAEQMQQSRRHWIELSESSSILPDSKKKPFQSVRKLATRIFGGGRRAGEDRADEDRAVETDNRKVFMELQSHPLWGDFFKTFGFTLGTPAPRKPGYICGSAGVLRVGEKFAEGAQAELFHVHMTWTDACFRELYDGNGHEWVMKVFKKGTLLRDLQSQWPLGYLLFRAELIEKSKSPTFKGFPYHFSAIVCGVLLEDGRFPFVMRREVEDLRRHIDNIMMSRTNQDCGPFSKDEAEGIMWCIANGMKWFHSRNIVHRDLKASNVLVGKGLNSGMSFLIADYKCSIGVVGTNFFRAPEILQACKDRTASRKPKLYTKAVDVYSYGMTCYEIVTGGLPFEDRRPNDYDHVLNGHRPKLPPYVDGWICELLKRCWDANFEERTSFGEILSIILANSERAKYVESCYERFIEELSLIEVEP